MIHSTPKDTGWIEVICGSMFSGKTEELIRRIRRAQIAKQAVVLFKPAVDQRYSAEQIVSHDQRKLDAVAVQTAAEILARAKNYEVIGIDEVQFFGPDVVSVCETLAHQGKRVVVSGLDMDYRGVPFEPVPQLLAIAEYITKTQAICMVCGNPGSRTQRLSKEGQRVLIGGADTYEARCRKCWSHKSKTSSDEEVPQPSLADA